jgi:hypothetical protein
MIQPPRNRTFTLDDQNAFAELSGDWNPIHVDPVAARRLFAGAVVVHGVHAVLWALDASWPPEAGARSLGVLRVSFPQPLRVGERVECSGALPGTLRLTSEGRLIADVKCAPAPGAVLPLPGRPAQSPRASPRLLPFEDAPKARGAVDLQLDSELGARLFPRLSAGLPPHEIAVLLAATRIVGMECPGLHSVFSGLELHFSVPETAPRALRYRVEATDARFRSLRIAVESDPTQVSGRLGASYRQEPVGQPSMRELAPRAKRDEMAGHVVLVVGASRGLGEVAAKLAAAGGAEVVVTYQRGRDDAERVVADIASAGGRAVSQHYDVLETGESALEKPPTMLLYFPTPYISYNDTTTFSPRLFHEYGRFYVEGFVKAFEQARAGGALRAVLYPSSSALDEVRPKAAEYAAAKAAGETVCAHLRKLHPAIRFLWPRLPRLLTDRSATVLSEEMADAGDVLMKELRQLLA